MFKEMSAIASMMKQAQGMSGKVQEMQERLADLRAEGQAGGGMVVVEVNGQMQVLSCLIDPALIQSGDHKLLGELVCSATNHALQQIRETQMHEMQQVTGGINVPGLSDTLAGMGLRRS